MHPNKERLNSGVLRNMLFTSVSAGSKGFLLILLILAGRTLGNEDYGKFSFALALVTIVATMMDFGLNEVTIRSVARNPGLANIFMGNTFALKSVLAIVTLGAVFLSANALRSESDVRMACYLLGGSVVVRSYLLTISSVLQALERFALESVVVSCERLMLLILGILALTLGYGLTGLAFAFVLSRVGALVVAGFLVALQVGRLQFIVDLAFWRELQISALPFGLFLVVLNLCAYIDTVMLGVLRTDTETGVYNAAYRIYEGLAFVPPIISTVLNPRLAKYFVDDRVRHLQLANAGLVITVLLGAGFGMLVFAFAGETVTILFGPSYMAAQDVLRILVVGLVFVFPIWVLHGIVISINRERLLLKTALVSLGANVLLNLILIPSYGMHGAAIATVASEVVGFGILFHVLRDEAFFRIRNVGGPPKCARVSRV